MAGYDINKFQQLGILIDSEADLIEENNNQDK